MRKFSLLLIAVFLINIALINADYKFQAFLAYGTVFFVILLSQSKLFSKNPIFRITVISATTFLVLRYWFFRTFDTLGYTTLVESIPMYALYLAETYAILIFLLGAFVYIHPLERKIKQVDTSRQDLPVVDIFIPTYNEDPNIVKITCIACKKIEYPAEKLNIYILDDGGTLQKRNDKNPQKAREAWERHETFKKIAQELKINYITREKNVHAKAGNINHALFLTKDGYENNTDYDGLWFSYSEHKPQPGDLILILDCDHVPTKDILKKTVAYFLEDEKLFLVQTPHFFVNPSPLEKNLKISKEIPWENEMFYRGIQKGLDFWNAAFFCGSAAVLRRKYLMEVGGIAGETITEDAETALTLHSKGYNSVYFDKPMIAGLSPETFDDFLLQRSRWAQGMVQIFLLKNPILIKGLSLAQRLCYLNSIVFWFFGFARNIFLVAPFFYIAFGMSIYNASIQQIFIYTIPYLWAAGVFANYMYGHIRRPFFSEIFETVQSLYLILPIIGVFLNPRFPQFKVTPKGGTLTESFLNRYSAGYFIMLALLLIAIPIGLIKFISIPNERAYLTVGFAWLFFSIFLIVSSIGALYEARQLRRWHRIKAYDEAEVKFKDLNIVIKGKIDDLSLSGIKFISNFKFEKIKLNQLCYLKIKAPDGKIFEFEALVKRFNIENDKLEVGFLFSERNSFDQIVEYVYSYSDRWEKFLQEREKSETIFTNFFFLFSRGLKGFLVACEYVFKKGNRYY